MRLLTKKKRQVIISITSLIDVVLLLLIFFMLTTTFAEQPGMELELPTTEGFSGVKVEQLNVSIGKNGNVALNGEILELEKLPEILKQRATELENKSVTLKADKETDYGLVINVMDKIKLSGLDKIIIATEQQE